jgi:hypothetical protein
LGKKSKSNKKLSGGPTIAERSPEPAFYLGITAAGIAVRVVMVLLSARYGFAEDHDDLARWGIQATDDGVLTLYDRPAPPARMQIWSEGKWEPAIRELDRLCNYPPLCAYLLWISGEVFTGVRPDRLVNTTASRASVAGWSFVFDVLLAAGCAALAARLARGRGARSAYTVALLAPPFWAVSSLWGQVDTWVLAPAVWMVWAMTAGRWGWAGVLFGLTAALKPQAAAFIPVWVMAVVVTRPAWKPLASLVLAAATLNLVALPYTLHSGATWWRVSYQANLFEHSKGMTTLMAFNLWYIDCLFTRSIDETARWWGVSKAFWGQAALGVTLLGGFFWTVRRFRRVPECFVVWTMLAMLAFVMVPTRVHDRFILLVLPFLIVVASARRALWPGTIILLAAATGQVTWPQWLSASSADWELFEKTQTQKYEESLAAMPAAERARQPPLAEVLRPYREDWLARSRFSRPLEWILTILSLSGAVMTLTAVARWRPSPATQT